MEQGPDFEEWVSARQRSLLRTAWLLTGEAHLAEDLVQAALLRCWARWPRIRRMDDVDAYVRKVVTTTYLSWRRRRWTGERPTADPPERAGDDGAVDEDRPALLDALQRLSRGQRAAVVLRYADDLSEAQTAELLNCSVGTVKSQTARALRALRADAALLRETDPA